MKKLTGIIVTVLLASLLIFAIIACKKKKECNGNPKKNCICTMEYAPVCGCDNKTYGNGCEAECNGVKSYTLGECGI